MQAQSQASSAARKIVSTFSDDNKPSSRATSPANAAASQATGPAPLSAQQQDYGNLIQHITDLKASAHAFKVNAYVFRKSEEILGSLLDDQS